MVLKKDIKNLVTKARQKIVEQYSTILNRAPIDIYKEVIKTGSPSVNFCFGNGQGLPLGYTALLWGPAKSGKTLLCNSMIGWLHQNDPDAVAIKINTEMREEVQLSKEEENSRFKVWGIDPDRYICFETNNPNDIFGLIEKDLPALIEDGLNVKLVVIDSLYGIQGRMSQESADKNPIGDHARTIQEGLKRILPVQRKHKIAVLLTTHVRADLSMNPYATTYGTVKFGTENLKMQGSWGLKHFCEYFLFVAQDNTKDSKTDLLGNELFDDGFKDVIGNRERTGHKIRVTMTDSSCGTKGRTGLFTIDYRKGIINTHEEIFLLGVGRGIIERPNNMTYQYKEHKWKGKAEVLKTLAQDVILQKQILTDLQEQDRKGVFSTPEVPEFEEEIEDSEL